MPSDDIQQRLSNLSTKQAEWRTLEPSEKLDLLEQALTFLNSSDGFESLDEVSGKTADMMGYKEEGLDRNSLIAMENSSVMMSLKTLLEALRDSYKARVSGKHPCQGKLDSYVKGSKVMPNGQVVTQILPLFSNDHFGMVAGSTGELWFDPKHVKSTSDVKPLAFDELDDKVDKGALLVLGAGNQSMLGAIDTLHGLFIRNRVVFLKHHPLRGGMEPFLRKLLAGLFEKGYLDSELHDSLERTSAMIYSEHTSGVHLTGGKATHDAIVWGSPNGPKTTKKLTNAEMSSELGCITPWIVTPTKFTNAELQEQTSAIYTGAWFCSSANCNAVKVVIMSSQWEQKQAFRQAIIDNWKNHTSPCAYYPGAEDRWNKFEQAYPNAMKVSGQDPKTCKSTTCLLPLLAVDIDVDLSSVEGQKKASQEYAFRNEAFAPVLVFATIQSDSPEDFMQKSVKLCNECLYGSLSMSMSVPSSAAGKEMVETAIADLKYGTVAVNLFSAATFLSPSLTWGGYPGDTLDNVESGIGKVFNALAFPHIAKCVVRSPCYSIMHVDANASTERLYDIQKKAAALAHNRNPISLLRYAMAGPVRKAVGL